MKKIFNYTFQDLNICQDEFLLTLSNPTDSSYTIVKEIVDDYFLKLELNNEITGGYTIVDSFKTNTDKKSITLHNKTFYTEKIIVRQLKNVEKIAIVVGTAGNWVSNLSQKYTNDDNILEGYILDQIGSLIVEKTMDKIHKSLELDMFNNNLNVTKRISPGYCGWNVAEQSKLFALLPNYFCNISLTDSAFMKPTKSLSGIVGIGKNIVRIKSFCNECSEPGCLHKKDIENLNKN